MMLDPRQQERLERRLRERSGQSAAIRGVATFVAFAVMLAIGAGAIAVTVQLFRWML